MNILPKKKWHVRTKENMARVRRDEANAAAEDQRRLGRVKLAEQEDRINRLKRNASATDVAPANVGVDEFARGGGASYEQLASSSGGHVNFFADLEQQERKNLAKTGNTEYQKEKRDEQHAWESKMGI